LFNEGYKPPSGDRLLAEDLCQEPFASRRSSRPSGGSHAGQPRLLSLMLLTAARFPSRLDEHGALAATRTTRIARKWDQSLIGQGSDALVEAAQAANSANIICRPHRGHPTARRRDYASTDWTRILRHYDQWERMKPSPIVP